MKRQLFANYTEATVTTIFTSAVEALISSAQFVKVKGKAVLDHTLMIREAATGLIYTLEYGEESPLLDGSQGIYCTKDIKEPSVKLTIIEYSFDSYSEEDEGQGKPSRVNKPKSLTWAANKNNAADYSGEQVFFSDVGPSGTLMYSNGTSWINQEQTIKTITASRSATKTDTGGVITYSSADNITVTIESDATSLWDGSETICICQLSTGTVAFAAGAGVTINVKSGLATTSSQYGVIGVMRVAANAWCLI